MLQTQIAQQATFSSTRLGRFPSDPEPNLHEHCNYVTLKGGLEDSTSIELEDGGEVLRAESEVKNAKFETLPFGGVRNVVVTEEFPPELRDLGSFSIPCMSSQVMIDRALCDLGASVSLMPYPIFQKLGLGELQPKPI